MNVDHSLLRVRQEILNELKGKKLYLIEASRKEYITVCVYAASVEEAKEEFFDDCSGDDWSTDDIYEVREFLDEKADITTVRWSKSHNGTYFDDEVLDALYAK